MDKTQYRINLGARIANTDNVIKELNKQIESMQKHIHELQLRVDDKGVKNVKGTFDKLEDALQSINVKVSDFNTKFTKVNKSLTSGKKTVEQYRNASGDVVEVVTQMNNEHAKFSARIKTLNSDLAKNADIISSNNAKYKDRAKIFESLAIKEEDFQKISSVKASDGTVTERLTDNTGKLLTLKGKLIDGELKYSGVLKEVNKNIDENAKQANKWGYSWERAFQSFTTYMSVSEIYHITKRAIVDMVNVVIDLDSALVELRKVTDLEGESLNKFTKDAYNAGTAVAKTGKEMIEAATSFAKAGYDSDLALQLGKVAAMYTNIADEEIKVADAADMIIAQMKAFNMDETEDTAMRIIDVINEVSNNFAVSSADISKNLGKASAVMSNAGNSYEQMVALMTAGTEITRSADKVANGLKTITLRLQENLINPWCV